MVLNFFSRKSSRARTARSMGGVPYVPTPEEAAKLFEPAPYTSPLEDAVLQMAHEGRYCVMLRDQAQWAQQPHGPEAIAQAKEALEQRMALVPMGTVAISPTLSGDPVNEADYDIEPFLLDVHCVTNARFQKFVDAGGYDSLEYWPEEIWPHLIELKDLTGQPAPRYWRQGRHDLRITDHPVVGISWYEAQAYALWIGERLPTEMEWQMAASWHIKSSTDVMRRFPWGDAMDSQRCNVWASRKRTTVPVDSYPEGAAPNQVLQLVGNVWEWTDSPFEVVDDNGNPIVGEMPMHSTRGGAFDTYFEGQATSLFRTGQLALSRSHNTGFRCAMNLSDAIWLNDC